MTGATRSGAKPGWQTPRLACGLECAASPRSTSNIDDQLLTTRNVALLLLAYPLVKTFHEFGHAYAVKMFGGAVHEIGVMVLILIPVPYVDTSSSAAFRSKWQRAMAGAAGITVEAGLAAIAVMVGVAAEPGMVRALAFNVILIGAASARGCREARPPWTLSAGSRRLPSRSCP